MLQWYQPLPLPQPVYQDAASIADIYALQQALIKSRVREKALGLANGSRMRVTTPLCLIYNLKNGSHFVREYHVNLADYARELKPLYESSEYKRLHYPILSVNPADVTELSVTPEQTGTGGVQLADREQLRQAVAALQNDIRQQTYEGMTSGRPEWAIIDIRLKNNQMTEVPWDKSDANFGRYLQNIGAYDNALVPDDLQCALVQKTTDAGAGPLDNQTLLALENSPDCLKITDPRQLETCLIQYKYANGQGQEPYRVLFILKGGISFGGVFSEADAPAFVRQYFARQ
jgi:ABC-2 type transport system permease protein